MHSYGAHMNKNPSNMTVKRISKNNMRTKERNCCKIYICCAGTDATESASKLNDK